MLFGPVIDKDWRGSEAVLPDEPFHLIKKGNFLRVPWIVGTNKNDGAFRVQGIQNMESIKNFSFLNRVYVRRYFERSIFSQAIK